MSWITCSGYSPVVAKPACKLYTIDVLLAVWAQVVYFPVQLDIFGSSNGVCPWAGIASTHLHLDAGNI